jgi:hypothetical protein
VGAAAKCRFLQLFEAYLQQLTSGAKDAAEKSDDQSFFARYHLMSEKKPAKRSYHADPRTMKPSLFGHSDRTKTQKNFPI